MIAPAAAALRLTRRLPAALALAAGLAMAAGVGGLALSYYADLAAGASVALCAAAAPIFVTTGNLEFRRAIITSRASP